MPPSRSRRAAKAPVRSGWRYWFWNSLLMIGTMILLFGATAVAIGLVVRRRFGAEMAVAFAYSAWSALMIFFPGRGNPGYNPFGAIARRVWWPLLQTHLLALCVVIPAAMGAFWLHARYSPRWLLSGCVVFAVVVSMAQGVRSLGLLERSEMEIRGGQRPRRRVRPNAPSL